ncbi:hypothetical protein [Rheinheimera sp.]|uniref:hypothetical protein n=1 Tax=Rheinheimera sp. TaxID=1869214 RepID=UPI0023520EC5|nr:hypothetical protein [Rheinheimera sp.]
MARSLAFWLDSVDTRVPQSTHVELHFNLWTLRSKKINYLDIGVRLKNAANLKSVNFYVPFDSRTTKYDHELGKIVCNNEELINAVFNRPFKDRQQMSSDGYYDWVFVSKDGNEPIRFFTHLQTETPSFPQGVKITDEPTENGKKGFRLSFPFALFNQEQGRDSYFRFRLKLSQTDTLNILTKDRPTYSAVTNNHEVTETIDFRINETRNLPTTVSRSIRDKGFIKKIHFFLIRDGREEYKMSHINYKRCRILENDLWGQYLNTDGNQLKEQMLIYHWTTKDDELIDHFSAFAKFSSKPVRWPQILAVLLVTVLAGFFSSMFTNFVWQKVEKPVVSADNKIGVSKDPAARLTETAKDLKKQDTDSQEAGSK